MDPLAAILSARDVVAVLGREVPVRLMDISTSGCLLESDSRLDVGTTGVLRVTFDDEHYMDDVRVMRCRPCEGSSARYQLGAEFLWTTTPRPQSLRRVVSRLQANAVKSSGLGRSPGM